MKFKYGDRIVVIDGFFVGMTGYAVDYIEISNHYQCELSCHRNGQWSSTTAWVKEEDLGMRE